LSLFDGIVTAYLTLVHATLLDGYRSWQSVGCEAAEDGDNTCSRLRAVRASTMISAVAATYRREVKAQCGSLLGCVADERLHDPS
jgi:hypothetical protein